MRSILAALATLALAAPALAAHSSGAKSGAGYFSQPGYLTSAGAADTVEVSCQGMGGAGVVVTGTFVGTITPAGSVDDSTWTSVDMVNVATNAAVATTTGTGDFWIPCEGFWKVRVKFTAYTSGRANVVMRSTAAAPASLVVQPGTGASSLGKAEDAAHASGDVGVAIWGVRNDNGDSLSGTNGDYTPVALSDKGEVQVIVNEGEVTATQASGWAAPAACTIGGGISAQTGDFAVLAATADARLCGIQIRDTGAGTAAGTIRHAALGANCDSGNVIAFFNISSAGGVFTRDFGDRGYDVASGVCVDVSAGTMDASWASVNEAAP